MIHRRSSLAWRSWSSVSCPCDRPRWIIFPCAQIFFKITVINRRNWCDRIGGGCCHRLGWQRQARAHRSCRRIYWTIFRLLKKDIIQSYHTRRSAILGHDSDRIRPVKVEAKRTVVPLVAVVGATVLPNYYWFVVVDVLDVECQCAGIASRNIIPKS